MADGQWTPSPDFNRLRTALLRQGEPDRVPLHDSVDVFLKKRFKAAGMRLGRAPGCKAFLTASRQDRLTLDGAPPAGGHPA